MLRQSHSVPARIICPMILLYDLLIGIQTCLCLFRIIIGTECTDFCQIMIHSGQQLKLQHIHRSHRRIPDERNISGKYFGRNTLQLIVQILCGLHHPTDLCKPP